MRAPAAMAISAWRSQPAAISPRASARANSGVTSSRRRLRRLKRERPEIRVHPAHNPFEPEAARG